MRATYFRGRIAAMQLVEYRGPLAVALLSKAGSL